MFYYLHTLYKIVYYPTSLVKKEFKFIVYVYIRDKDFRVDYEILGALCAAFSNVSDIAMTATASRYDRECIKKFPSLKSVDHNLYPLEMV